MWLSKCTRWAACFSCRLNCHVELIYGDQVARWWSARDMAAMVTSLCLDHGHLFSEEVALSHLPNVSIWFPSSWDSLFFFNSSKILNTIIWFIAFMMCGNYFFHVGKFVNTVLKISRWLIHLYMNHYVINFGVCK